MAFAAAVFANPYAGRHAEDLLSFMQELRPPRHDLAEEPGRGARWQGEN